MGEVRTFASFDQLGGARGRAIGYLECDAVGPDAADVSFGEFVAGGGSN